MSKSTGGPAFPRPASEDRTQGTLPDGDHHIDGQKGMDLRDYFAAKAMAAISQEVHGVAYHVRHGYTDSAAELAASVAEAAYVMADAMLKEREK